MLQQDKRLRSRCTCNRRIIQQLRRSLGKWAPFDVAANSYSGVSVMSTGKVFQKRFATKGTEDTKQRTKHKVLRSIFLCFVLCTLCFVPLVFFVPLVVTVPGERNRACASCSRPRSEQV